MTHPRKRATGTRRTGRAARTALAVATLTAVAAAATAVRGAGASGSPIDAAFRRFWGARYAPAPATDGSHGRGQGRPAPRAPRPDERPADVVRRWNAIAVDASGLDHTPVAPGEQRKFGEQLGPGRSSRAMAIVHVAMFEAANAVTGGDYRTYAGITPAPKPASLDAAVAQAARDTLAAAFPSQRAAFDAALEDDLAAVRNPVARANGVAVGRQAAAAILSLRADDGADHDEAVYGVDYIPGDGPGLWRKDPVSQGPLAMGCYWGDVRPFTFASTSQFRVPPPPALGSAEYAAAFDEVKRLGGDGVHTPTERTADQALAGVFWAYDGTPSLCAPPRLYNQIALRIADQKGTGPVELSRLLALLNVAMADAGVAIWESKYHYKVWRPVTGVREADAGTGPTGAGDGNPATLGDPEFLPLGAPASNLAGPNFTPPFPAYPSGHAGFGGAVFQTLRRFYGTDAIPFTFVSDELNGVTRDPSGAVRPRVPRSFRTLSEAEEENGQSRVYLGIHWSFDKTAGIRQGRDVADHVFDSAFTPADDRPGKKSGL